jgi:acyl carrier protein
MEAPSIQGGGSQGQRAVSAEYEAPATETEEAIVKIWQKVLLIDPIGVNDDFFELGGDSISSIQILNRIRKRLEIKLANDILFRFVSPRDLSAFIDDQT